MSNTNTATATASKSFPILGLLGVILVVLKLNPGGKLDSAVEDASWWLVLLPFYLWFAILLFIIVVGLVVITIGYLNDERKLKKRRKENAKRLQERRNRFK